MTSQWVLTDDDVRDLLAVFERQAPAEDGEIFYPEVLIRLRELIPCDDITFQLMDVGEQRVDTLFVTDEGVQRESSVGAQDEYMQLFWREFWEDDGCAGPLRTGDYTTVLRHSDFWAEREYADTPLGSMWVELGLRHEVLVPLTPYGGTDRRLLLWRSDGPDFTERELMMLRLVRPHVAELHARRDRERAASRTSRRDSGGSCAGSPPARATPGSRATWASRRPPCANTWRTSTCGCTCSVGPRHSRGFARSSTPPETACRVTHPMTRSSIRRLDPTPSRAIPAPQRD